MIVSETIDYVLCPHCGKGRARICHLYGKNTSFGPWYCNKCGNGYRGRVEGQKVTVEKSNSRVDHTTVFLQYGNILLACQGRMFDGQLSKNNHHYYNEYTCPINYLHETVDVLDIKTGEWDAHGIFGFIGEVPEIPEDKLVEMTYQDIMTVGGSLANG